MHTLPGFAAGIDNVDNISGKGLDELGFMDNTSELNVEDKLISNFGKEQGKVTLDWIEKIMVKANEVNNQRRWAAFMLDILIGMIALCSVACAPTPKGETFTAGKNIAGYREQLEYHVSYLGRLAAQRDKLLELNRRNPGTDLALYKSGSQSLLDALHDLERREEELNKGNLKLSLRLEESYHKAQD